VITRVDGIVTVGPAADDLTIDKDALVAALMMGAQRVAERAARRAQEWWREGARRALGEEREARLETER
jgi:hypothetical protein